MGSVVRSYRAGDLADLVAVSRAADRLFARVGINLPPDDPAALLARCPVVLVVGEPLVGFIAVEEVDGNAHISQLAVRPERGRQGLGGRLLDAMARRVAAQGLPAITLTTFRDVPWNAPWYAERGFGVFPAQQWGEQLRSLWADEERAGIAVAPRVAMRRICSSDAQLLGEAREPAVEERLDQVLGDRLIAHRGE